MNVSKISNCSFKGVYLTRGLKPGEQYELGAQIRDLLNQTGLGDKYERQDKDILIDKATKNGIYIHTEPYDVKRLVDDNYQRWNGRF